MQRYLCSLLLLPALIGPAAAQTAPLRFDFGTGHTKRGWTAVQPGDVYSPKKGYGFVGKANRSAVQRGGRDAVKTDFCTADGPFYFTVDVPEGNYDVTVTLGDADGPSTTNVRAESRRMMLPTIATKPGEVVSRTFTVSVRYPEISATERVRLKPRELDYLNWDHQLTLEFNGPAPKVASMEIRRNDRATTVFLAGNSTVVDQDREPWAAWGQMIPRFFVPEKVVVANHAESGEALKSFYSEKRLDKILSLMKPGDYLFIEFAHNDQKPGTAHVDPFTTYQEMVRLYIAEARKKGGIPVLVTSMHRRNFDSTGHIVNTLGDYPEALRQTAKAEGVALIDLNAMSKVLYEAWGPEASLKAFVHHPANTFPGQTTELKDNTHFSTYGAFELARCVVEGIRTAVPDLARHLTDDLPPFNPASPDPIDRWDWPLSPMMSALKPDEN
ncbi:rhamnogalacturonan acetylesterase [Tellurirhabdus rosea]|uniref:rhamnogalacturonan acetylesterase n=1 Tax=Tellurirhabdus rosea TaxID=2674997 RepID=UPI002258F8D1|nr:rhamnogalacturonan acetylesterase [Tellurirhabdus rosea]